MHPLIHPCMYTSMYHSRSVSITQTLNIVYCFVDCLTAFEWGKPQEKYTNPADSIQLCLNAADCKNKSCHPSGCAKEKDNQTCTNTQIMIAHQ